MDHRIEWVEENYAALLGPRMGETLELHGGTWGPGGRLVRIAQFERGMLWEQDGRTTFYPCTVLG